MINEVYNYSVCPYVYSHVCSCVCVFTCVSLVCPSMCPSMHMCHSVCPSMCPFMYPSMCSSMCPCVCVCCLRLALVLNDRRTIDEALIRKSTLFSGRTLNYSAEFFYNPKAKGKTVCSIVMVRLPPISVLMGGGARGCI